VNDASLRHVLHTGRYLSRHVDQTAVAAQRTTYISQVDLQLENYVGPVPTYCAAVRLAFDLLS